MRLLADYANLLAKDANVNLLVGDLSASGAASSHQRVIPGAEGARGLRRSWESLRPSAYCKSTSRRGWPFRLFRRPLHHFIQQHLEHLLRGLVAGSCLLFVASANRDPSVFERPSVRFSDQSFRPLGRSFESATSGKAGGLEEGERLKAARPCGRRCPSSNSSAQRDPRNRSGPPLTQLPRPNRKFGRVMSRHGIAGCMPSRSD